MLSRHTCIFYIPFRFAQVKSRVKHTDGSAEPGDLVGMSSSKRDAYSLLIIQSPFCHKDHNEDGKRVSHNRNDKGDQRKKQQWKLTTGFDLASGVGDFETTDFLGRFSKKTLRIIEGILRSWALYIFFL